MKILNHNVVYLKLVYIVNQLHINKRGKINDSSGIRHLVFICSSHVNSSRKVLFFKSQEDYMYLLWKILRIHSYSVTEIFHPLNNSHFPCRNKEVHGKFKRCCMCLFPCLWSWYPRWWLMFKLVKFYTLYMHCSLYINYISMKLKKKVKRMTDIVLQKEQVNLYWAYLFITKKKKNRQPIYYLS